MRQLTKPTIILNLKYRSPNNRLLKKSLLSKMNIGLYYGLFESHESLRTGKEMCVVHVIPPYDVVVSDFRAALTSANALVKILT